MLKRLSFILPFLFFTLLYACKKDHWENKCEPLKHELHSINQTAVKDLFIPIINSLPSKSYSEQHLHDLANAVNRKCDIEAEVLCFNCIETFPPQSEIKLTFQFEGNEVVRIIDISYSASNEIRIRGVHE